MSNAPEISVVMGVYNGADTLSETINSILSQEGCDFEFIIVNDGSTDNTADILDAYAKNDHRVRVIHQENTGLTRALIRGCSAATGSLIARQDAGDISLPNRLVTQKEYLSQKQDAVMVGCGVRFISPENETLYELILKEEELDQGLRKLDLESIKGPPHHGGTMFRKNAYLTAGGYRAEFKVAQDLDLWLRLSEIGRCLGNKEVLYTARLAHNSISFQRRGEQFYYAQLLISSAKLRRKGEDDRPLLQSSTPPVFKKPKKTNNANFYYFLASCLYEREPLRAKYYIKKTLKKNPFHLKALLKLIIW